MNIQLSISLLVSDRADTLKKCLKSLRGLLKELPCELIVVFTGEKEETLEIVRQYTEHIVPFKWCNDFSAARNAGLREAKGEWFLYLDDDEWFEDTEGLLTFFKSGEYRNYKSAAYIQRNYTGFDGMDYSDSFVDRLVRRTAEVRFISSIHEHFEAEGGLLPQKYIHDFVHHYGYVRASGADRKKGIRTKRNIPLLLEEFENNPDDGKTCAQLAQEYKGEGNFRKAEEYAEKGLQAYAKNKKVYTPEYWMMVQLPAFIAAQGNKKDSLCEAEKLLSNPRRCELVEAYLYAQTAELAKELHEPEKGICAVQNFHKMMQYMEQHKEKTERQSAGDISFEQLQKKTVQVYTDGLSCASQSADFAVMQEILQMFPWDGSDKTAEQQDGVRPSQKYAGECQEWCVELEHWKEEYATQLDEILHCFVQIESDNPYILLQKALLAEREGRQEDVQQYYKQCAGKTGESLEKEMCCLALRNNLEISALIEKINLEHWNMIVHEIAGNIKVRVYETNREVWKTLFNGFPLYYSALEQQFLINTMLEKVLEGEELIEALRKFCQITNEYCEKLYNREMLTEEKRYCIPELGQFSFLMSEVLEASDQNRFEEALRKLREALSVYPELTILMKRTMEYLIQRSEKNTAKQNPEFAALGAQVKQLVQGMLENKQYREAETVIGQLCMLLPDDMEVLKMKQILLQHLEY